MRVIAPATPAASVESDAVAQTFKSRRKDRPIDRIEDLEPAARVEADRALKIVRSEHSVAWEVRRSAVDTIHSYIRGLRSGRVPTSPIRGGKWTPFRMDTGGNW